jgi:predicted membrane protein
VFFVHFFFSNISLIFATLIHYSYKIIYTYIYIYIQNAYYTFGPDADLFQKVQDELRRLKIIVKGHEKRIKTLEDKLTEYDIEYDENDE